MKIQKGMVAAITGAGGGIGRCVAQALAARGVNLALADIDQAALEQSKAACAASGVNISLHICDVSSNESVEAFAAEVLAEHGKVNILDNNAGITIQKSFETHTLADWERMMGINVMGVVYGCRAFLPVLKDAAKNDGAHIINMSSMAGFVGLPNQATYSSAKAAVRAISETLYAELAHDNIGVTSVHPGMINTDMILATLDESDDVKQAEKSYKMVKKMGIPPEYAAQRIVRAIEKNHLRIRIGKDAIIVDILKRLLPVGFNKLLPKIAAKARGQK
ncbi:MAG: SDR family NAD(P)-dependent oxidoreductase [Gammaproteobacteria bacterium]|nr:SDR family NAD(P)-dependent oxidoreductase [Gammaproteobacteria bacterium]